MSRDNNGSSGGIGFFGFLTLIFITLKLIGVINWSWWWVLSPMWIWIPLFFVIILIFAIRESDKRKRRRKKY